MHAKIVYFSGSNYAGDPVSRKSISGFILYVLDVPVSWQSKAKKSMTCLSSEAEWVALPEAVKEVMFMMQLLGITKISVKLPVMVRVDDVRVLFMTSNMTTTSCTKHVDIK